MASYLYLEDYILSIAIPFTDIKSATKNLADENIIARGRYANLYKGQLSRPSGKLINIVVREYMESIRESVFVINELKMYKDLKHKNILSLFKVGESPDGRLFTVHKHEGIESLDKLLPGSALNWMQRLRICVGVAHALHYLHFGLKDDNSVIHGNINSSLILLNHHDLDPILHDFRCAVKVKRHNRYVTSNYNGTLQYKDPAFESTGGLTHKSDVFSFGVVLFEVLFGTKASTQDGDNWYFARMARRLYEEKRLDDMIDGDLRTQMDKQSLELFSETANFCLKEEQAKRPDMDQIVKRLERALELHQSFVHPTATTSYRFKEGHMDHLKIPLSDIKQATEKFSKRYLMGSGAYGKVYKAELNLGGTRTVAIKRIIKSGEEHAQKGFVVEVELLSKCEHTNIVSLLGFCDEDDEMILVYEFASNGSLEGYLGKVDKMTTFTWAERIKICLDIANGLQYIHKGIPGKNRIIHRDIKSENILLDEKWVAKIADFGLSRLDQGDQQLSTIVTDNIAGTPFYFDPVYQKEGKLKEKTDIYSLGVVLFEMFCGKLAYDQTFNGKGLATVARLCYKDGTIKELVDPKIKEVDENNFILDGGVNEVSLEKFSDIAYKCVAESQNDRPTIEEVIKELQEALHHQENNKDNLHISLEKIKLGTENFSDRKCIAKGRYWKQYIGEITHANKRTTVVAKRWNNKFPQILPQIHHQFITELKTLYQYKHENIISLVGYCIKMGEKIIVYEHAYNGSLDKHLDNDSFTWTNRLKICIDVARGLEFLHTSVSMMHTNIKSASIVLDGDWNAKISNLELCAHVSDVKPIEDVTCDHNAYGSSTHLSPDDIKRGYLTRKSDIYSLGVVLKEIWCKTLIHDPTFLEHIDLLMKINDPYGGFLGFTNHDMIDGMYCRSDKGFKKIVLKCSSWDENYRPKVSEVITYLKKALELQEDYEEWKPKLPRDYNEIINLSDCPEIHLSSMYYKDRYRMLSEGILLKDGKVLFSLDSNGERNEMISARKFSFKNCRSYKWRSLQESRFQKVAEVFFVSNLNIKINIRTQFLSSGVNYGVHLVFKFRGSTSSTKPMYVNLNYKMSSETFHAYFATPRDDNWMMIELHRFLKTDAVNDFEFLLESFSQHYCGNREIYVEGIEFRAIDNEKYKERKKTKEAQVLTSDFSNDQVQPLQTWISRELVEFKRTQVISITCKIKSQILSQDIEYACYFVFKLSEQCQGLHCPIRVRDVINWKNKEKKFIYFRSPNPHNLLDGYETPKRRDDGLMEVIVWNFNSTSYLRDDYIPLNLKLITYEGTMSGLIQCGYYITPM